MKKSLFLAALLLFAVSGFADTIINNFNGQLNTTVTAVGVDGMNGWNLPGTAAGLRQALQQIGGAISAAPDPSKEQFILYAADHGDQDIIVQRAPMPVAPNAALAFNGFPTFTKADLNPQILLNDPLNVPGFTVFVPFTDGLTYAVGNPFGYVPFFQPGSWEMLVDDGNGHVIDLTSFTEKYLELGDGIIGDQPGEGVELFFPMDKLTFTSDFFDTYANITIINHTSGTPRAGTYLVNQFDQDSGAVARVAAVPEPRSVLLLASALLALCVSRRAWPARRRLR